MTDADDVPVCASCADPMDTSDREYTEDESICDECAQDGYIAALARIKALEVESERKQAAIDELSKEWAMTDAELDIVQLWVDKVGDNNTALEKDLADDVDRLVAEVRRLRSDAAIDSDNMVRFLSRAEQAETELFQAQDSERRAVNALETMRAAMRPLRWTTTPPGPEHEGRWFWVRWPDGDEVVWQYIPDLPNNPVFVAWSGPLPEPEPGE